MIFQKGVLTTGSSDTQSGQKSQKTNLGL